MSSKLRWMPDWLTGPSLGQYMKVRPGDKTNHTGAVNETPEAEEKGLSSTKQMLKKHMVDSFFERALHQIDPELVDEVSVDELVTLEQPYEASRRVEPLVDVVTHEPIYEAEVPLDDKFLVVEEDSYVEEVSEEHIIEETDIYIGKLNPDTSADQEEIVEEHIVEEHIVEVREDQERVGYYVVAITLGHFEFQLPDLSIDEAYPLFVFPFGSAQAIISKVPLNVYSDEALQAKLNDPAWFEGTLRKHTQILGQIQTQASIVPMRVCTICDSKNGLDAFLREHHDDFVSTLELIEGNYSWRFSIYCNEPRLRTLTAKASNRVRAIQAEMAGKTKVAGQPLHEKLEAVLEEEARSVCKACVKHSHGTLSVISSKNIVQSFTEDQAGDTQKREIFRCEYLVSVAQKDNFKKNIGVLVESYKSLGFELEIDGPYSPAKFAGRKVLPAREGRVEEKESPIAVS
ncbi:MAG: GvpL/GvpF family gas vesicle protein [Rhodothermales bacterium]